MRKVRTRAEGEKLREAILKVVGRMTADAEGWIHGVMPAVIGQLGSKFQLTEAQVSHHLGQLVAGGRLERKDRGSRLYRVLSRNKKSAPPRRAKRGQPRLQTAAGLRAAIQQRIATKESELTALRALLDLAQEDEAGFRLLLQSVLRA